MRKERNEGKESYLRKHLKVDELRNKCGNVLHVIFSECL